MNPGFAFPPMILGKDTDMESPAKSPSLTRLCGSGKFILTAHRGASWEQPENTLAAMNAAVDAGADMIEFDLRASRDGVPILLHDATLDRTTDGAGRPEEHDLAALKKLNASWFRHGQRLSGPCFQKLEIPTFEEVLAHLGGRIAMNIQVYARDPAVLTEVLRLHDAYNMRDRAYFTVGREMADALRALAPDVELCLTPGWEERSRPENLRLCRAYGCRFAQPIRGYCAPETFRLCRGLGLTANVFFADDPDEMRALRDMGADGVLTNRPELPALPR